MSRVKLAPQQTTSSKMGHQKIRGIIIRLVNVKDYDRYLSVLTKDLGVISVYARRIRSAKSKLGSRCQLFSFGDFELFENKGHYSLNEVETVHTFPELQKDMLKLTAASALAEMILDNTHERQDSEALYELFIRACYELEKGAKDSYLITWLAEMKMMNVLGYRPQLQACRTCAAPIAEPLFAYFDYYNGSLYCDEHGLRKSLDITAPVGKISQAMLRLLRHLADCPLAKTFSVVANQELIDELGQFTLRFIGTRLDKNYDKFSFFKDFALPSSDVSTGEDL